MGWVFQGRRDRTVSQIVYEREPSSKTRFRRDPWSSNFGWPLFIGLQTVQESPLVVSKRSCDRRKKLEEFLENKEERKKRLARLRERRGSSSSRVSIKRVELKIRRHRGGVERSRDTLRTDWHHPRGFPYSRNTKAPATRR